ncbi:MAG TPA: triose-phosphate isomerase [Nitrososphaerales archaeon]|nr:triose-phosphate isomerase [Nitrososphaerales archaeon]
MSNSKTIPARDPLMEHLPIIIINFKTYEEATGDRALKLARICRSVATKFGKRIIISPQFTDIYRMSMESSPYTPVFAQHIDDRIGKFTGSISPLAVREAGAVGTLLNHSERRLPIEEVGNRIKAAKAHGLMSLCFADSIEESLKIAAFEPEMIAYEPPELVGTGISVSTAKPSQITDFVRRVTPSVRRLVGAGISNPGDVKKALELGADGWGVSSAFTKAKDPERILTELVEAS